MSQTNWEADKMLDVYIHDYLVKRDWKASAQAFQTEGKVSADPVAIDAPGGFLFEWWSVFWDIFIARTNEKHSEVAASYIETQLSKAREQQQPQQPQHQQQPQQQPQHQHQQQLQMQQIILQRQAQQAHQHQQQPSHQQQQQRRDGSNLLNGSASGLVGNEPIMRQNTGTASSLATKLYEDRLKPPLQRDSLDDTGMKQRFGENVSQLLDPNHASILKSAVAPGQSSGQVLHGASGGMSPQVQARNQQIPGSTPDIKTEMNQVLNPRVAGPDGSMMGSNQGGNNLTLKGWPLTGLDQLRPGLFQQNKPFMPNPQPLHQIQMLSPQQQHQQYLLSPQSLTSPSSNDLENRKMRVLLNSRGLSNSIGDVVPNVGSPMQSGGPVLPRDTETMLKLRMAHMQHPQQNNNQQQQQLPQHVLMNQQQQVQSSNYNLHPQDKNLGPGSVTIDGSMSNSFRGNDQTSKIQTGRKRKQPVSSSGPANSSGTANTAGPSPSSAPSTPSTQTPGDVISMPMLAHNNNSSSKPLMMFGADNTSTLISQSNQLWGDKDIELPTDMDRYVEDGSLEDNVESFLSHDEVDARDPVGHCMDVGKGFTFSEINSIQASGAKVTCCHFSSDGKLLATGGQDKKAVLWCTDSLKLKTSLEEHSSIITDVRFSPTMSRLATSSYDKTVRVWDVDNPDYSLRTFTGHSSSVMSLDFHPNKEDLICSCDSEGEIRFWSINNGSCPVVLKGATSQMRFQPRMGRYLATTTENVVSIWDVESQRCRNSLQGHKQQITSICWDPSGEFLASVSEDSVRVWRLGVGSDGELVHDLSCNGNKFWSCAFHPAYSPLLVVGCYQSMELWNMIDNKTMTLRAHDGLITSLAVSPLTGLVASVSHDKFAKLWK